MQNTAETDMANHNRNLIPFAQYDSQKDYQWGYVDEDTGEIIIAAQYAHASPFVGNYAVVRTGWHNPRKIMNKNGKILSVGLFDEFDDVYFITAENGKSTAAILEDHYKRTKFDLGIRLIGSNDSPGFYTEDEYKYRLVNLATGKTIIPKRENYLIYNIEIAGDYFVADTDLYQFMDNGDIKCVAHKDPALTVKILQDYFARRCINAAVKGDSVNIEIDYSPYIKEKFANPDLSGAFQKLSPAFDIPFDRYEPFYRDPRDFLNAPLEINERKYILYFADDTTGRHAMGLYNESKDAWELEPYFDTPASIQYYIVDIGRTNNPHLYRLGLLNDDFGWVQGRRALVFGGIYSTKEYKYKRTFYLYEDYPPRSGTILRAPGSDERSIKFPSYGVYYRDYGRIAAQTAAEKQNSAHARAVIAVSFSPDGTTVISGDRNGEVKFWDARSGEIIRTVPQFTTRSVASMAISPDGKSVAVGSGDGTVKIWSAESGEISTLRGHTHWVNSVAFSPDGKYIAAVSFSSRLKAIVLMNLESGQKIRTFNGHKETPYSIVFSPDGKTMVSGDKYGILIMWNRERGEKLWAFQGHTHTILSLAFSPDGKTLVTGAGSKDAGEVKLWDAATGSLIRALRDGHENGSP